MDTNNDSDNCGSDFEFVEFGSTSDTVPNKYSLSSAELQTYMNELYEYVYDKYLERNTGTECDTMAILTHELELEFISWKLGWR
jgi:hypothetical protein